MLLHPLHAHELLHVQPHQLSFTRLFKQGRRQDVVLALRHRLQRLQSQSLLSLEYFLAVVLVVLLDPLKVFIFYCKRFRMFLIQGLKLFLNNIICARISASIHL